MKVRDAFAEMDRVSLDAPMSSADVGPDVLTRDALLAKDLPYVLGGVKHGHCAARREGHRQLHRLAEEIVDGLSRPRWARSRETDRRGAARTQIGANHLPPTSRGAHVIRVNLYDCCH
jgi:hypothetical protein